MSTISDVAKLAGVAPVTVSRVINNAENVSPATREKILQAIDRLGYVPSGVAQSLRSKRTRSLALLVPDITNIFWPTVARGIEDAAQNRGYSILLCNTDEDLEKQRRYLDVVVSQRVAGVIIAPHDSSAKHLVKLRQRDIPTVIIDRHIEGWDVDTVHSDSVSGARALVRHLIDLGHRRIAIVTGPRDTSTAEDRVTGYRLALSEAGLPVDERMIKHGEFRSDSRARLTEQLLAKEPRPTAIFTANNVIVMRVLDALIANGIRIPQDMALVCFDDLPNISSVFPFFTVADQPAYEMGINAAQLLFSRIDAEVALKPRHVILPTRLIIRHSCGSRMAEDGSCSLSLPLPRTVEAPRQLVKLTGQEELQRGTVAATGDRHGAFGTTERTGYDSPAGSRLLQVLHHHEADRLPRLIFGTMSPACYEYVLERKPEYEAGATGAKFRTVTPQDQMEFARRTGMDAIVCDFAWRPSARIRTESDLYKLEIPSLSDQLNLLERYFRAAQGSGVAVIACFSSFFQRALELTGLTAHSRNVEHNRPLLEKAMDYLLHYRVQVVQTVCDRFGPDLACILINDTLADAAGPLLDLDPFMEIFSPRMRQLISPAQEHGKLIALHSGGKLAPLLPMLHDVGFDILYPEDSASNDLLATKTQWQGKMACIGNILPEGSANWPRERLEDQVRECCARLAPGGGYVAAIPAAVCEDMEPSTFFAVIRALRKYGYYEAAGKDS